MHAFFFGLVRSVLKHGPKSLTVKQFFVGAKPASALKALASTAAQATDCDLESRLLPSLPYPPLPSLLSLSSLSLLYVFFVFSLSPYLCLPLSSFFPHHHRYLHFSLNIIFIIIVLHLIFHISLIFIEDFSHLTLHQTSFLSFS